jgi:uncharacterized membrane protein
VTPRRSESSLLWFAIGAAIVTYAVIRLALALSIQPIVTFLLLWVVLILIWFGWNRRAANRRLTHMKEESQQDPSDNDP